MYLGKQCAGKAGMWLALLPAFSIEIGQYHLMVLSEGLSIPLFAMMTGLSLHLMRKPSLSLMISWILIGAWFSFTRTSNPYAMLIWAGMLLVMKPRVGFLAMLWTVIIHLWLLPCMQEGRSGRYQAENMNHLMLYRILPNPEAREYFEDKGVPMHEWIPKFASKDVELAVYNAHRKTQAHELLDLYPDYTEWLIEKGDGVYMRWLLFRPQSYVEVFTGLRHSLSFYILHAKTVSLPPVMESVQWRYHALGKLPIALWLLCGLIPLYEGIRNRSLQAFSQEGLAIAVLLLSAYGHGFLSYHGHPGDVSRYMLASTALFRVTFFVAAVWGVRQLAKRFSSRAATVPVAK